MADEKVHILICGGRHFTDYEAFKMHIDEILGTLDTKPDEVEIVSGHAQGTDTMGEQYAAEHSIAVKIFPADWKTYGKAAGPIRNREMVRYISQFPNSMVIGFTSDKTKGTNMTLKLAQKNNIKSIEIFRDTNGLFTRMSYPADENGEVFRCGTEHAESNGGEGDEKI